MRFSRMRFSPRKLTHGFLRRRFPPSRIGGHRGKHSATFGLGATLQKPVVFGTMRTLGTRSSGIFLKVFVENSLRFFVFQAALAGAGCFSEVFCSDGGADWWPKSRDCKDLR